MRKIVLDTETTGLSPDNGHRIIEIGCVEIINDIKAGEVFHCYINPERDVPMDSFRIHGISSEFLQDKPIFKDVCQDFIDFISDSKLIIHNANFDMNFINYELRKCNVDEIFKDKIIDTLYIARKKFPGNKVSLDALCKLFNISLKDREKHGALIDAKLLLEVYIELLVDKQPSIFLERKEDGSILNINKKKDIPYRKFPATDLEIEDHNKFMINIKNKLLKKKQS